MAKFAGLRGMDDLLPGEIEKWQWLEQKARIFFEANGFKEIRTPILELAELFSRSIGEASDIVHKEMFSFEDRGGRNISLRPEMTASVARAVIEHGLLKTNKSLWLYYMGPMFRAERPQAGRKRQFHQIGVEIINEAHGDGFNVDFRSIFLLCSFLSFVGVKDFRLRLNDLGNFEQQQKMSLKLKEYFSGKKAELCPDCHYRLEKNVLRVFDCKNKNCRPAIEKTPWDEIAPLDQEFGHLIDSIKNSALSSKLEINRRLVRGLDYYNGAVFEVAVQGLGAQDAVAGGGRYDHLYSDLGAGVTPCTGFSIGTERLLRILEDTGQDFLKATEGRRIYFASLVSDFCDRNTIQEQLLLLRESGFRIEMTPRETSLSTHLKRANQLGIRFVLIWGEDEMKRQKFSLKDLDKRTQTEVEFSNLVSTLRNSF